MRCEQLNHITVTNVKNSDDTQRQERADEMDQDHQHENVTNANNVVLKYGIRFCHNNKLFLN